MMHLDPLGWSLLGSLLALLIFGGGWFAADAFLRGNPQPPGKIKRLGGVLIKRLSDDDAAAS